MSHSNIPHHRSAMRLSDCQSCVPYVALAIFTAAPQAHHPWLLLAAKVPRSFLHYNYWKMDSKVAYLDGSSNTCGLKFSTQKSINDAIKTVAIYSGRVWIASSNRWAWGIYFRRICHLIIRIWHGTSKLTWRHPNVTVDSGASWRGLSHWQISLRETGFRQWDPDT